MYLRKSEVDGLDRCDVTRERDCTKVRVCRAKNDPVGRGRVTIVGVACGDSRIMFQLFELAMFGLPSPWPVRSKVARQLLARWLARRHVLAMQRSGLSASSRRHHQHDHTPRTTRFKLQQHPQLHQKLSAHPPSFGCTLRVGVEVWRLGLTEVERLDRSGLEEMRSGIE